jgi:chemotaxis protein MotB
MRPIDTILYPSNWELATARASSVVRLLIERGIPPRRLAAAGFGEFHPLDDHNTEEAYRRNRRIELKLTQR